MQGNNRMLPEDLAVVLAAVILLGVAALLLWLRIRKLERTDRPSHGARGLSRGNFRIRIEPATVFSKRVATYDPYGEVMVYHITFALISGGYVELAVEDVSLAASLTEGTEGLLQYRGNRFISFLRSQPAAVTKSTE